MVRIILIRHGETTWNVEGRYQGQEDIPLSPKGIAQGKAVGLALKDISIDAAVSGPLSRSFDTCRFITEYHHVNIRVDERITEISHGRWEGVHADEIKKSYPKEFELWHNRPEQENGTSTNGWNSKITICVCETLNRNFWLCYL